MTLRLLDAFLSQLSTSKLPLSPKHELSLLKVLKTVSDVLNESSQTHWKLPQSRVPCVKVLKTGSVVLNS